MSLTIDQATSTPFREVKYILIFLTLFVLSCTKEVSNEVEGSAPPLTALWVSIQNKTTSPLSLSFRVGIADTLQKQHLIYEPADTLLIEIGRERLLTIDSKFSFSKELIVIPGDSLYISLERDGIDFKGSNLKNIISEQGQIEVLTGAKQDSLYNLLVKTDSSQSMRVSNDYSTKELIPIFFQEGFYSEFPDVLNNFTESAFDEVRSIISPLDKELKEDDFDLSVQEELQLNKNFLRLSFLVRKTEDKELMLRLINSPYFEPDFLMKSQHGLHYLFFYIQEVILKGEKDRSSNKLHIDYKRAYDLLGQHFEEPLLAKARLLCLNRMVENAEPYETISAYATDYQNTYPNDSMFMQQFQSNFLLNQEHLVNASVGLNLLNEKGSTKMLTGLLKELKGKVVYVDYWASWCAPCRTAMPSSLKLREAFGDKEVAFVYFSIDRGQEEWRKASKSDGLEGYVHNYLVLNHEKSEMKQQLEIEAIPRYLIFNKEGKLVEKNAPSPVSAELEIVLNQYLSN